MAYRMIHPYLSRLVSSETGPGLIAGLFPVGSIPAPSSYMFARDMEKWEKPVDGAEVKQTS